MSTRHVISPQANLRKAQVKGAPAPGRRQNYLPPEAAQSIHQTQSLDKVDASQ